MIQTYYAVRCDICGREADTAHTEESAIKHASLRGYVLERGADLCRTCGSAKARGPHDVEAWRRGYEPRAEFGWHCLTCEAEGPAPSATAAERLATAHARARPDTEAGA